MTPEQKMRAEALHAALKAVELFKVAPRNLGQVTEYIMLAYNWINCGKLGDKVIPPPPLQEPLVDEVPKMADPSQYKANKVGGR